MTGNRNLALQGATRAKKSWNVLEETRLWAKRHMEDDEEMEAHRSVDHSPESDGLPYRAPADVWIHVVKDMAPEAWDFAVASCLRPTTRSPGPTTTPTLNLAACEKLHRCHRHGLSFTPVVFDGHVGGWGLSAQPGHLDLPPAQHHVSPHTVDLKLVLSHSTVFPRVPTPCCHSVPTTGGQPGMTLTLTSGLSTDHDALTEIRDDESLTTTTLT